MFEFIHDGEIRMILKDVYNEILNLNLNKDQINIRNPSVKTVFDKIDDNIRNDIMYNILFIFQYGLKIYEKQYKKRESEILEEYTSALMTIKTKIWHEVRIGYALYTYDDDDNIVAYYDDNTRKVFLRYFSDKNEQIEIKQIISQSI